MAAARLILPATLGSNSPKNTPTGLHNAAIDTLAAGYWEGFAKRKKGGVMSKRATRLHEVSTGRSAGSAMAIPDQEAIAIRAYQLWVERGSPIGSDQEDWFRAEEELKGQAVRAA